MKMINKPSFYFLLSGLLLLPNLSAWAGTQGRSAEILAKSLYCHTFDFLAGDFGIILGLLCGFAGFLIMILRQMNFTGFLMILGGICLTALPFFLESTFSTITQMANSSGLGNQPFELHKDGRQTLRKDCDYDAGLQFIQQMSVSGGLNQPIDPITGQPLGGVTGGDFYTALGNRECGSGYTCVNQYGYMGRYQMGCAALTDAGFANGGSNDNCNFNGTMGITDLNSFLNNPAAQDAAIQSYHSAVWGYIQNQNLDSYIGSYSPGGTLITQSGLLAAAHLAGTGNLANYLNGSGWTDGNGTSPDEYLQLMGGYGITIN